MQVPEQGNAMFSTKIERNNLSKFLLKKHCFIWCTGVGGEVTGRRRHERQSGEPSSGMSGGGGSGGSGCADTTEEEETKTEEI